MLALLRQRIENASPLAVDTAMAVGLAMLTMLQVWTVDSLLAGKAPLPPGTPPIGTQVTDAFTYLLVAGCFLPLALRRTNPLIALALSTGFALAYALEPRPPAFALLGPMIALYTTASMATRRRPRWIAALVLAAVLAIPLLTASQDMRWLRESVSAVVLMSASAFLGDSVRSRREYIEALKQRATDAERTREEEASRRVSEERIRIARELHDVLAHSLSIVTVQAAAAETLVRRDPEKASESIRHIRLTGKQALAEVRSVLGVMRTDEGGARLEPTPGITDVERLVTQVRDAGYRVSLVLNGNLEAIPAFASVSAYRIVQEALTNAVRHASPRHIEVHIDASDALRLRISDDGQSTAAVLDGHGIRGMRERIEALGGTFAAGPCDNGGFEVTATIPLGGTS